MEIPNRFSHLSRRHGFTLVEIMIVAAIIALLSALAVPAMLRARTNAQRARLLKELKTTADAFETYAAENIKYPLQTPSTGMSITQQYIPPAGMELYLPKNSTWRNNVNGSWYWMYWPDAYKPYKGIIYLVNPNLTSDDIAYFDKQLDDGNTATGSILDYGGGQLLYFLQ